ncbi:hypothetical protein BCR36DRAFT_313912, partial [Piromyces finnis]
NVKIIKYLMDNGKRSIDINKQDNNKWTPFRYACIKGYENIVKYLINNEAYKI